MTLVILAGVWALAFGHITITQSLRAKGNAARILGVALILVAAYGLPQLSRYLTGFMPHFVSGNEAFRSAYELLIGAFAIYATGWVMNQVTPKLKIPSVTVSLKRQKAA